MGDILQFCRPEEVGVAPEWVENYVSDVESRGMVCHSFLMMRGGKVFAEGYWAPFRQDELHRMYSVSKTFVSAAIGLLVDEGKLRLTDRVADYFPDKLPARPHPWILEATVEDLLRMATPHTNSTYYPDDPDWVRTFFDPHTAPSHPAGTVFSYDTSGTYVLDALVERLTGKPFLEFLKDRMLREIGFSKNAWCVKAPEGIQWGGSGVECSTRDLARFATVFLNGGCAGGKRFLSESYVRAATTRQIDNCTSGHRDFMNGNGYGYQIWMTHDDSFSFCGMGGQLAVCIPKYDFLFVCTSDVQGNPTGYVGIYAALWKQVVEKLSPSPRPRDDAAFTSMQKRLRDLTCVVPVRGELSSSAFLSRNGRSYRMDENPMGISRLSLTLEGDEGVFTYETARGRKAIRFGMGRYVLGTFPETHYFGDTIGVPAGHGYRCMTAGVFSQPEKLVLACYLIDDYFGNFTATFSFKGDEIAVYMEKTAEWFLEEYQGFAAGRAEA